MANPASPAACDPQPAPALPAALITGAGRGIGRGIALGLAGSGHPVALLSRSLGQLDAVAADCAAFGVPVAVATADVCDPGEVRRAVTSLRCTVASIGLLVNAAGRIEANEVGFGDDDLDDAWDVIATNVRGPMIVTQALLAEMLAQGGGRVVNLNSGAAHRVSAYYTAYSMSKIALSKFTRQLARQYGDRGIRAFDVAPGTVRTAMTDSMPISAGRTAWTPLQATVDLVRAIGTGRLDALSGRFLHADADTVESLTGAADLITGSNARIIDLCRYGADDPLHV